MLIKNGKIIDGFSKKMFNADIRIEKDKIQEIGTLKAKNQEQILNAKGMYITPGFVDILNHSDAYLTLFENTAQESLLQQGITTILIGNCGSSLAPLVNGIFINSIQKWGDTSKINLNWLSVSEYLNELSRHSFGVNLATLMGHSTIRRALVGDDSRSLTTQEQKQLEYMIEVGMREGAFGVSSGLAYSHGKNATAKELRFIMNIVKKYDGLYSVHIKNEADGFLDSVKEMISLVKESGVNMELSHLKVIEKEFWNKFEEALALIEKSNTVNFDVYPYTFTASVAYTFLPRWASEGGNSTIRPILKDPQKREKLLEDMKKDPYSYAQLVVAMGNINKTYFGKKIGDIAKNQGKEPEEVLLELILASDNRLIVFSTTIDENNIKMALKHPKSIVTSDGVGYQEKDKHKGAFVHPRYFGAIPKFLGEYVREQKLLSWEEAINKISLKPAEKIGLKNRGKLVKGYYADIVIFDPNKIGTEANLNNPYRYPQGIKWVLVNGNIAVEENKLKSKLGRILKRNE